MIQQTTEWQRVKIERVVVGVSFRSAMQRWASCKQLARGPRGSKYLQVSGIALQTDAFLSFAEIGENRRIGGGGDETQRAVVKASDPIGSSGRKTTARRRTQDTASALRPLSVFYSFRSAASAPPSFIHNHLRNCLRKRCNCKRMDSQNVNSHIVLLLIWEIPESQDLPFSPSGREREREKERRRERGGMPCRNGLTK